ncbi:MAG: hypothetical protein ACOCUM_00325 [Thiohalospira sp.]
MADHRRQKIRDDVVATLTGLATTGSNVVKAPFYPVRAAGDLPGLAIRSGEEAVDEEGGILGDSDRTYQVDVEAALQATQDIDDQLDTILVEVEEALAADRTRGGLALDTRYVGTGAPEYQGEQQLPVAFVSITFEIDYRVPEGDPDAT